MRLVARNEAADLRTAVSRAYYAAFHVASDVLEGLGFRLDKGAAAHGKASQYLLNSGDTALARVGSQLSDLHGKRIDADYRLGNTIIETRNTAVALVAQAHSMIQALDQGIDERRREAVKDAIRRWLPVS